ncbi:hypothetical protein ACFQ6S_07250 [Streptomyces sp. NPDC056479]|uniref:hypothetical protein n=1 Tax=Streptomyces sp. NPDC056479 TaxID=3345832 RepID=UPI003688DE12
MPEQQVARRDPVHGDLGGVDTDDDHVGYLSVDDGIETVVVGEPQSLDADRRVVDECLADHVGEQFREPGQGYGGGHSATFQDGRPAEKDLRIQDLGG